MAAEYYSATRIFLAATNGIELKPIDVSSLIDPGLHCRRLGRSGADVAWRFESLPVASNVPRYPGESSFGHGSSRAAKLRFHRRN
jgi:hypothetical protein